MYQYDEKFIINKEVLEEQISLDELDLLLDKYLDKNIEEEDEIKCVHYILQLFYRSGKRETSTNEIHEKLNNLIGERVIHHLKGIDVIDEFYDPETDDWVYKLNENGQKLIEETDDNI